MPAKLPVPEVVQLSDKVPDAVAELTVKVLPWHKVASAPAFTCGAGVMLITFIDEAEPLHGAIPKAVRVRLTEPAIRSPALGV